MTSELKRMHFVKDAWFALVDLQLYEQIDRIALVDLHGTDKRFPARTPLSATVYEMRWNSRALPPRAILSSD